MTSDKHHKTVPSLNLDPHFGTEPKSAPKPIVQPSRHFTEELDHAQKRKAQRVGASLNFFFKDH